MSTVPVCSVGDTASFSRFQSGGARTAPISACILISVWADMSKRLLGPLRKATHRDRSQISVRESPDRHSSLGAGLALDSANSLEALIKPSGTVIYIRLYTADTVTVSADLGGLWAMSVDAG